MTTTGLPIRTVTFSQHCLEQAVAKGFTAEQITSAIERPYKVTEVSRFEDQERFCGAGVAVVIDVRTRQVITVYVDGVVTPMRSDQVNDPSARSSRRLAGVR